MKEKVDAEGLVSKVWVYFMVLEGLNYEMDGGEGGFDLMDGG